jgi:quercetin dioxygenase-like cupin family protein
VGHGDVRQLEHVRRIRFADALRCARDACGCSAAKTAPQPPFDAMTRAQNGNGTRAGHAYDSSSPNPQAGCLRRLHLANQRFPRAPTPMKHSIAMNLQIVQTGQLPSFAQLRAGTVQHELGLGEASGGMFAARRVRCAGRWNLAEMASETGAWLVFLYLLRGHVNLRLEDQTVRLGPGDATSQIPLSAATVVDRSGELEFFELVVRDDARVRALMPMRPAQSFSFDAPELHVQGQGPRNFFDYRDLGLAALTGGQVEIQIIRAQRARQGGTGWHSHTMAQLSYGLSGWASLGIEGVSQPVIQAPGDSLCIPPEVVHNADSFSDDYAALQLQIPARYETRPREDPRAGLQ